MNHTAVVIALALGLSAPVAHAQALGDVDVFIGAEGGGNTVPGAGVPFGFVSVSPDTAHGDSNGYDGWSPVVGFSATHVSGTGGASKYGNFRVTPTTGAVDPKNLVFHRAHETASPGLYSVDLPQAHVELTASRMVAVERYAFTGSAPANLLIDATSAIQLGGGGPKATAAHVDTHADGTISGWAAFTGGWNGAPYKLYFDAVFDRTPTAVGTWTAAQGESSIDPGVHAADGGDQRGHIANRLGAYARFSPGQTVTLQLAVSFVSVDRAKAHLTEETGGKTFDAVRSEAEGQWIKILSTIDVDGGTPTERTQFYSALYRLHTMPHDLSGDNAWWTSNAPHYEDFYTLWDTFRTVHPLLTLIEPQRQRDMVRSLLDTYAHTGWLPDARIAGANGLVQGGTSGDVVIADAVVKHLGGFDLGLAWQAVDKDGDVEADDQLIAGRELKDYLALGYMSLSQTRSATRTLEYAYDDFAIAEVAKAAGHPDDAARFLERSENWRNLWDDTLKCIHPRYADGSWLENYDCDYTWPDSTTPWWDAPFYEGSGTQYSTYVPQDPNTLMKRVGGKAAFIAWLDHLFDGHYDAGNEPDILVPYLYLYAGRPDKTADALRRILAEDYHPTRRGLPGNDDAGTMSAWYVWNAIGLYPNAGQPFYYIGSPLFTKAVLHLEGGKTFTVLAPEASASNRYVAAAALNGRPLDRAWLSHDEIAGGGTLELKMAAQPGTWAARGITP
jgi:predicted alpha-1,2-mannosidase